PEAEEHRHQVGQLLEVLVRAGAVRAEDEVPQLVLHRGRVEAEIPAHAIDQHAAVGVRRGVLVREELRRRQDDGDRAHLLQAERRPEPAQRPPGTRPPPVPPSPAPPPRRGGAGDTTQPGPPLADQGPFRSPPPPTPPPPPTASPAVTATPAVRLRIIGTLPPHCGQR